MSTGFACVARFVGLLFLGAGLALTRPATAQTVGSPGQNPEHVPNHDGRPRPPGDVRPGEPHAPTHRPPPGVPPALPSTPPPPQTPAPRPAPAPNPNPPGQPGQGNPGGGGGGGRGPDDDDDRPIFVVPPPVFVLNPPPVFLPPSVPPGNGGGGLMLGPGPAAAPDQRRPKPKPDPAKSQNLVAIGDRLFRANNSKKARERYDQARAADPTAARPHVRLAQLALVKGDYKEAAARLRAATSVEPGWLVNAEDVQALFAEPGDFAKALTKLETHLQASPKDRDGWLVLGAETYLSGKTRQASDIFTRLSDRKPDPTLAAFLDAAAGDAPAPAAPPRSPSPAPASTPPPPKR